MWIPRKRRQQWRAVLPRLRVRTRLLLGFGLVVGLAVCIAVLASIRIHSLQGMARAIADIDREQVAAIRSMQESVGDAYVSTLAMSVLTEKEELDEENEFLQKFLKAYDDRQRQLLQVLSSGPHATPEVQAPLKAVVAAQRQVVSAVAGVLPKMLQPGDRGTIGYNVLNAVRSSFDGWQRALRQLSTVLGERSLALVKEAEATAARAQAALLAASLVSVVVGALTIFTTLHSILPPLRDAMSTATLISQGDLTCALEADAREDELGELLSTLAAMQEGLKQLVEQVQTNGESIVEATEEISHGTQDLSHRTEQTAGRLQQTTHAIESVAHALKDADETADRADRLANDTARTAQQGGATVHEVVAVMKSISLSSNKIQEIIAVIDGIAFQTNILALNAAVEAAQAGEHGRGFAVVAGEVRALATHSGDAAREIRALIGTSLEHVREGVTTVQRAGQAMDGILHGIGALSAMVGEISRAVRQQAGSLANVSHAIAEIDDMTQQNAALVEQARAATQELGVSARHLRTAALRFKTGEAPSSPLAPQGHAPG